MKSQKVWITLSEALSWLAFGEELQREGLRRKLAAADFSSEILFRLGTAVEELVAKARDGEVELQGRYVMAPQNNGASALTAVIPAVLLADYRAFDITTDGLRYGHGLRWLPDEGQEVASSLESSVPTLLRPEHYVSVTVDFPSLKRISRPETSRARLSDAALRQWWSGLSDAEKREGETRHREMLEHAFPENTVSRERLRGMRRLLPRHRGRAKKSP